MTQYPNWIANSTNTVWKHRHNHNVVVAIVKASCGYKIFHSHPGPNNSAIMQQPEGAMSMESARKRAEKHLLHWSESRLWKQDSDYGRLGKTGA